MQLPFASLLRLRGKPHLHDAQIALVDKPCTQQKCLFCKMFVYFKLTGELINLYSTRFVSSSEPCRENLATGTGFRKTHPSGTTRESRGKDHFP